MMKRKADRATHRVSMLAFPDAQILDITGPLEVFARTSRWIADNLGHSEAAYSVEVVAECAGPLRTSGGIEIIAARSYKEVERADTLLVAGGIGQAAAASDPDLLAWLRHASTRSGRVGSICSGSLILGTCGLLSGRKATSHWAHCDTLARIAPDCEILSDSVYVKDGNLYTSAGVTAGMDLALALVAEDWGRTVALRVAQELVMFLVRPGGQSQFSRHLKAQQRDSSFGELELWMLEHLDEPLSVEDLADIARMSTRTFVRRFTAEIGTPPAAYLALLRVERARSILETTPRRHLKDIARECGFGSEQKLRRAFQRTLGITPDDYRVRFGGWA